MVIINLGKENIYIRTWLNIKFNVHVIISWKYLLLLSISHPMTPTTNSDINQQAPDAVFHPPNCTPHLHFGCQSHKTLPAGSEGED